MDRTIRSKRPVRKAGILGIGLDGADGHTYITRGDDFLLMGGSESTHESLRSAVAKFNQELALRGKTLLDLTEAELDEIAASLE
jgi:hypothetical protein